MYMIISKIGRFSIYVLILYTVIATATAVIYVNKYTSLSKYISLLEDKVKKGGNANIKYEKVTVPVNLTEKEKQDIMKKYDLKIDDLNAIIAGLKQRITTVTYSQNIPSQPVEPKPTHAGFPSSNKNMINITFYTDCTAFSYMRNFKLCWLGVNYRTPAYIGVTVAREY